MGNGSICSKKQQFDKSVQMPSRSPEKRTSTPLLLSQPNKVPPIKPSPSISPVQKEGFTVKQNAEQYSSIWDYNAKVSMQSIRFFLSNVNISLLY